MASKWKEWGFGLHLSYSLTKAAIFMRWGWELRSHVLILGPFGFAILWRKRAHDGVYLRAMPGEEECEMAQADTRSIMARFREETGREGKRSLLGKEKLED